MNNVNLQQVREKINPLIGQSAWEVALGVGSFITFEFGALIHTKGVRDYPHGEWHLWVTYCAWCLEAEGEFIAGSEDPRPMIRQAVKRMQDLKLCAVELIPPTLETRFVFEKDVILHLLPIYSSECESWLLYMPDGNVLRIGPGSTWSCTRGDQPYPPT